MANTVRIKRRASGGAGAPSSLANAELAFNEVDNTLYYGKGTGGAGGTATTVEAIAGSGAVVMLTGAQTVSGVKTFSSSPVVPTPITSDNSTNAASTAFVKAQGYLTTNQSITYTGDVTGSGTTSVTLTLATSGVTAGTYRSVTVDAKGRVTSGTNPTTLSGYGITDAQPLDADLTAIAALAGTSGLLRKTATDTWSLDTATYLTSNQSITISGDATGTGTTAITLTFATSGVTAGTYNNSATAITPFTVDAKGRVTATGAAVTITPAWSSITSKPTTISGYAITDAYTKTEVDTAISAARQGLDPKDSVRVVATANITLSAPQTIDGVSVIAGDRVLVIGQSTASQNGIYTVAAGAWTRTTDADTSAKVTSGMYVFVSEGTTNQNSGWYLTTDDPITLGTSSLNFVQFTGAGQITAGTGLTKSANTLSLTGQALALHNLAANGIIVRTGTDTVAARTFAVSGSGISVTNADGVSGNVTYSLSAALASIGGLTPAADQLPYYTGASTAALTSLTTFGRSLIDDVDAATARSTLGLGSMQTQNSTGVSITGGQITGLTTFDNITIDCGTF